VLEEALDVLEREPPGPELADLYTSLASERMVSGRFEEALEWAERSLGLLARLGAEHLRPRALGYRGVARCYQGDLRGIDDLHAAIALAERLGLAREQAKVLVILAEVVWATEGPARAMEAADSASRLATRRGIEDVVVASRTQTVGPLFDLGRWDDLLSVVDDVIAWSEAAGSAYDEITAQLWQAQVLIWRGRRSAESPETGIMARAREIADPQVLVPAVVVAGLAALDDGRPEEAIDLVAELDRAPDVGLGWYREHFLADLVRICVRSGDLSLASRFVDRAEAFTRRHRLSLSTARASLHEGKGDLKEASSLYEEAAQDWVTYGHVLEAGMASLGAARCLARLGDPAALDPLQRATDVFASIGAPRLLEEADRLRQAASQHSSPKA
jgi:tetratricopeptide (TPR) repeat protein